MPGHFQIVPCIAQSHPHLRYSILALIRNSILALIRYTILALVRYSILALVRCSILALSARQIELKETHEGRPGGVCRLPASHPSIPAIAAHEKHGCDRLVRHPMRLEEVLYSNVAAISGNQLYHTASILMLQTQPPGPRLAPSLSPGASSSRHDKYAPPA
jgi:hypothetical protein